MKDYVVQSECFGNTKNFQFDTEQEAIKAADKMQKTRKKALVVLKKVGETDKETLYKVCYITKDKRPMGGNATYVFYK